MAIDRIKKITLLCPRAASQRLIRTLHELGVMEVLDVFDHHAGANEALHRAETATEECDKKLQKLRLVLNLIDTLAPERKSFAAGLAPVPLLVTPEELDKVIAHCDLDAHYREAEDLDTVYRRTERAVGEISAQLEELHGFEGLPFALKDLHALKRVKILVGEVSDERLSGFQTNMPGDSPIVWERVNSAGENHSRRGDKVKLAVAFLQEEESEARTALTSIGFTEWSLPRFSGTVQEHIQELEGDKAELQARLQETIEKTAVLAMNRRAFRILEAFWESQKNLALARGKGAHGKWVGLLTGYVREVDLPGLQSVLAEEYENVMVVASDPGPEETVPVSLTLSRFVRPVQMLVNLFGLPLYTTFDPSPFIFFPFLLFFGICFSDVAYGSMLILLSAYLMYKTRPYEGVYNFARLLLYGGISTVIFGFLLGGWFGDLYMPQYLGENNLILRVMRVTQVIDPMQKPIAVLIIALGIGMLNQFYGIALKMYGAWIRKDIAAVLCDGLLWLVILPGFVILVSKMFAPVPTPAFTAGLFLFAGGAIGLVLTQGRGASGLVNRFTTGLISLYGIVGSYGLTAFIGDTMSYCRLLALALTTSIVALSFNMIAALLKPIPVAGPVLFIAALIVAHLFNFAICLLGAFVHSMRLIFVEFFGRFYTGGAKPFRPLGFDSPAAILKRN